MKKHVIFASVTLLVAGAVSSVADDAAKPPAKKKDLPPAATATVDFAKDIQPILEEYCIKCHGPAKQKSKLRLDSKEALLKGGENGPSAVSGDSAKSILVQVTAGTHPDIDRMPPKSPPMSDAQVGLLRAWIDQGIVWPAGVTPVAKADPNAPKDGAAK